jgi:hypothetical protein
MEKLFKNVQPSIDERDSFSELPDLKKPMQAIGFFQCMYTYNFFLIIISSLFYIFNFGGPPGVDRN